MTRRAKKSPQQQQAELLTLDELLQVLKQQLAGEPLPKSVLRRLPPAPDWLFEIALVLEGYYPLDMEWHRLHCETGIPKDESIRRLIEWARNEKTPVDRASIERWIKEHGASAVLVPVDESNTSGYTKEAPSSRPDDASQDRMRDDFDTAVKKAKAETLARAEPRPKPRSSTLQLATYRALVQNVDLRNPELSEAERLRRARRLVRSYQRVRERKPNFPASPEVLAAFSIVNKDNYRHRKAKAGQKATLAM